MSHARAAAAIDVADTTPFVRYTASAGQTTFAYPWPIYSSGDLKVYVADQIRTLTTHYTVTGVGTQSGGNVVLATGATAGQEVVIYRSQPIQRTSQYGTDRAFTKDAVNKDFNQIQMELQDLRLRTRAMPMKNLEDAPTTQMLLPEPDTTKVLGWCSDGETSQLCNVAGGTGGGGAGNCDSCATETLGIYNVDDYGTDGAAIQSAIAAAETAGGGIVQMAARTYTLSSGLTIENENVQLRGAGRATVLESAGDITMITVGTNPATPPHYANAGNVLRDFTLDLLDTNATGILWQHWGQIGLADNIHVVNPGLYSTGIETGPNTDVNEIVISGFNYWNDPEAHLGTGINIECNNAKIINGTIIGAVNAIDVATSGSISKLVVSGMRMATNDTGIRVGGDSGNGVFSIGITGNRFESNTVNAIRIEGYDATSNAAQGVYIGDDYFTSGQGIYLEKTVGAMLEALTFKGFAVADGEVPVTDGGNNAQFYAFDLIAAQDTDAKPLVPVTLSRNAARIGDAVHIGDGTDATSLANPTVLASRSAGETSLVARESNADVEGFLSASTLGVSVGAKTAHVLNLYSNGQARAQIGTSGALNVVDGITAPATNASWAQCYIDSTDRHFKVKHTDGSVDDLTEVGGGGGGNMTMNVYDQDTDSIVDRAEYADAVTTSVDSTNSEQFPLFSATNTAGNKAPRTNASLHYNPSSGALTATSFIGNLTGTANVATSATTVATTNTTTNAAYYPLLSANTTNSSKAPFTNGSLSYNPSTGALTATSMSASGGFNGNATTATGLVASPVCSIAGEYVRGIAANGTLTCSTPTGAGNITGNTGSIDNAFIMAGGTSGTNVDANLNATVSDAGVATFTGLNTGDAQATAGGNYLQVLDDDNASTAAFAGIADSFSVGDVNQAAGDNYCFYAGTTQAMCLPSNAQSTTNTDVLAASPTGIPIWRGLIDADIPDTITIDAAGHASNADEFAAQPTNCDSGKYAKGISTNGDLDCATPTGTGYPVLTNCLTMNSPVNADDYLFMNLDRPVLLNGIRCLGVGTGTNTDSVAVKECNSAGTSCANVDAALTCGTAAYTRVNTDAIDDRYIGRNHWLRVDSVATTNMTQVALCIDYEETATTTTSTTVPAVNGIAPYDWTGSMMAVYRMEQTSGSNATSEVGGSNYTLTATAAPGAPTRTAASATNEGSYYSAFTPNQNSGFSSSNAVFDRSGGAFTFAAWARINADSNYTQTFARQSGTNGWEFLRQAADDLWAIKFYNGTTPTQANSANNSYPADTWSHVEGMITGGTNPTIYGCANGGTCGSAAMTGTWTDAATYLFIRNYYGPEQVDVDEVVLDTVVWTDAQRIHEAACGVAGDKCTCEASGGVPTATYLGCDSNSDCTVGGHNQAICSGVGGTCNGRQSITNTSDCNLAAP